MRKGNIEDTLKKHTAKLMSIQGVVGVGEGLHEDKPCITVFVAHKTSELADQIPKSLGGHPVILMETGEFRALPKKNNVENEKKQ